MRSRANWVVFFVINVCLWGQVCLLWRITRVALRAVRFRADGATNAVMMLVHPATVVIFGAVSLCLSLASVFLLAKKPDRLQPYGITVFVLLSLFFALVSLALAYECIPNWTGLHTH